MNDIIERLKLLSHNPHWFTAGDAQELLDLLAVKDSTSNLPTLTESRLLEILADKFKDAWTDRDRQAFVDMLRAAGVEVRP